MKRPIILFSIALIIRLAAILFWRFDGLYGQDPYAYYQQAIAIAQNLPRGQPPPTDFFWPNGYPFLIAFSMLFVGQRALAGQLVALLCGALLSPLAYLLSRDLWRSDEPGAGVHDSTLVTRSHRAGILAGLIVAAAGQPILSSVVVMADMPALFWATLSAWLVVRAAHPINFERAHRGAGAQTGNLPSPLLLRLYAPWCSPAPWFLAAGATLALAIVSRWLYVLVAPALGFYSIFKIHQNRGPWWPPLLASLSGTVILAPQLWLSFGKPGGLLHSFLLGWSPANFFQRQFEHSEGSFFYRLPMAIFYAQSAGHPAYIFPLLGLASLWGLWRLWQVKSWGSTILLLGWIIPVYIFLAGIPFQNFRFGLTLYLPLVILTGFRLSYLLSKGAGEQESRGALLRPQAGGQRRHLASAPRLLCSPAILKTIITLSLLGMLAWAYPMLDNFLTAQNQSKAIARQVEQALPPEATLLTFGLTLTLQHYTQLNTLELFYFDEAALNTLTETQSPIYLLLDLHNIDTQWPGKTPQINYTWLRENTILTESGTFRPYVLFKVERSKSRT